MEYKIFSGVHEYPESKSDHITYILAKEICVQFLESICKGKNMYFLSPFSFPFHPGWNSLVNHVGL
jgi:hypothetical protein